MMSTVIGRSLASVRANDVWSNPRHIPGTTMNSVSSWLVTKRTSLSRQMGSTGFWTAPRRASATITTIVSNVVGSCHVTTVPSVTPRSKKAAAVLDAASRSSSQVRLRPKSSASTTRPGCSRADVSTSSQYVSAMAGAVTYSATTVCAWPVCCASSPSCLRTPCMRETTASTLADAASLAAQPDRTRR